MHALKLQMNECQLPFALTMENFDDIDNSGAQIMKHCRTISIDVNGGEGITHDCSCIFWKIVIDGETTHCSAKTHQKKNVCADAHECMSSAFATMNVSGSPDGMDVRDDDNGFAGVSNVSTK